jgi:hypothetical protein
LRSVQMLAERRATCSAGTRAGRPRAPARASARITSSPAASDAAAMAGRRPPARASPRGRERPQRMRATRCPAPGRRPASRAPAPRPLRKPLGGDLHADRVDAGQAQAGQHAPGPAARWNDCATGSAAISVQPALARAQARNTRRAGKRSSAPWPWSAPAAAGKTSLAEALLHRQGAIGAAGSVERGSTVSDFDPLERRMQHSLNSAVMHLDTPARAST